MTSVLPPSTESRSRQGALLLVGVDHRSAPLELRERVAYGSEESEDLLLRLLAEPEIGEAFVLSTCNRTEVYVQAQNEEGAYRTVLELAFRRRASEIEEQGRFFVLRSEAAARHLLAVAAGLESMVLGEPEVLGQLKRAAEAAAARGAAGTLLRRLLRSAATAGRRARAETAIGAGAVSLGYAVAELARNIFTRLEDAPTLVVGAGETARLVARSLTEKGVRELRVANRSDERAAALREEFPGARLVPFEDLGRELRAADLVVASTAATEPLIHRDLVAGAMRHRPLQPLLVVDLGVPRNVEPAAGQVENVFLHNLDSLEHLIDRNLKRRREEVPRVEAIIDQELASFRAWMRSLEAEPLVALLQKRAEAVRRRELAGSLHRFPAETHEDLERLTRSLVRKILHHPSARLRARGDEEELARLDLVRELFRLDEDVEEPD